MTCLWAMLLHPPELISNPLPALVSKISHMTAAVSSINVFAVRRAEKAGTEKQTNSRQSYFKTNTAAHHISKPTQLSIILHNKHSCQSYFITNTAVNHTSKQTQLSIILHNKHSCQSYFKTNTAVNHTSKQTQLSIILHNKHSCQSYFITNTAVNHTS